MLLRNAMGPPRAAAEYRTVSWEEANRSFRDLFLSGGDYDTGVGGAERLSPVAAAHRILCNDFPHKRHKFLLILLLERLPAKQRNSGNVIRSQ